MRVTEPIKIVFREVLSKGEFSWPAESSLISAGQILRREETDILRLNRKGILSDEAITGYSILSAVLSYFLYANVEGLYNLMFEECEKVAIDIQSISGELSLSDLFKKFAEIRFGHILVKSNGVKHHLSIYDTLELYERGKIKTDLTCGEVSSTMSSLADDATLAEVLEEMMSRKVRRIFVEDTTSFVSDRILISYLFSSSTLQMLKNEPERMMDVRMSDLGPIDAVAVDCRMPVAEAAKLLTNKKRDCLVCEKGVVTHWDCSVKPFQLGKMELL